MAMLYDITPSLTAKLAVWPGDTTMKREVLSDLKKGGNITLSTLHATVHLGAHADGLNHYGKDAPAIDERSLNHYLGPCQLIRVDVERGSRITPALMEATIREARVLFATGTYPDAEKWNKDFAALSV